MLLAIELAPKPYEDIKRTVAAGRYESVRQFVEVAVSNQLALEEKGAAAVRSSLIVVGAGRTSAPGRAMPLSELGAPGDDWHSMLQRIELRDTESLASRDVLAGRDDVLWGQTNRLLPVAAGVRVLAHLVAAEGEVTKKRWHETATLTARLLRHQLDEWDRSAGRKRGELWATALPDGSDASAQRYRSQFLGDPGENGSGLGGAAFLGLVTFDGAEDTASVRLSSGGAGWVSLPNPVFDSESPTRTFSPDEAMFFLDHLRTFRPEEYRFLATVASLVAKGQSRTKIDESLLQIYPSWSKFIGTMRSGAIGRLSDLGLLARSRRGLAVDYRLTDLGAGQLLAEPR